MRSSYVAGSLLAVALMSSTALAQNTTTTPPRAPAVATDVSPMSGQWRSSKLIGVNVYNEQNEKLGDINEIILDPSGKVVGYVIGVGGFLGMGEHNILVEPTKLKFVNEPVRATTTSANNPPPSTTTTTTTPSGAPMTTRNTSATTNKWYPDHAVLNATKDQLKALPQFKY